MENLGPKTKNSFYSPIFLAFVIIVLSSLPVGIGQHISPFLALIVVYFVKKEEKNLFFTLTLVFSIVLFTHLVNSSFFSQERENPIIKIMTDWEKSSILIVFFALFFAFFPKRISGYADLTCIVVAICFLEQYFVSLLAILAKIDNFQYIDFSLGKQNHQDLIKSISENISEEKMEIYSRSLKIAGNYLGTFNALLSGFYFMVFLRFIGKHFIDQNFSFRLFSLSKWALFSFLISWAILLLIYASENEVFSQFFDAKQFFTSVVIVNSALFFVQGTSIIVFYLLATMNSFSKEEKDQKKSIPSSLVVILIILFFLPVFVVDTQLIIPTVFLSATALGVFDMWFDYRKLEKNQ